MTHKPFKPHKTPLREAMLDMVIMLVLLADIALQRRMRK